MEILIYCPNQILEFILYIYLNKNWKIYRSEQSFTGLWPEDRCSSWGLKQQDLKGFILRKLLSNVSPIFFSVRLHLLNVELEQKSKKGDSYVGQSQYYKYVDKFGFYTDTCCGYLQQDNTWKDTWVVGWCYVYLFVSVMIFFFYFNRFQIFFSNKKKS
jgi:hypothetical protein